MDSKIGLQINLSSKETTLSNFKKELFVLLTLDSRTKIFLKNCYTRSNLF